MRLLLLVTVVAPLPLADAWNLQPRRAAPQSMASAWHHWGHASPAALGRPPGGALGSLAEANVTGMVVVAETSLRPWDASKLDRQEKRAAPRPWLSSARRSTVSGTRPQHDLTPGPFKQKPDLTRVASFAVAPQPQDVATHVDADAAAGVAQPRGAADQSGTCAPATNFQKAVAELQDKAKSTLVELTSALDSLLVQADNEEAALEQITAADEAYLGEVAKCVKQHEDIVKDVKTYESELQELAQIALARHMYNFSNWTAVGLLGEQAARSRQRGASRHGVTGARQAAELHWILMRAAKRTAVCQRGTKRQVLPSSISVGPTASPGECLRQQTHLEQAHSAAVKHILGLLNTSKDLATDDTCERRAESLREEHKGPPSAKLKTARQHLCRASKSVDAMADRAEELRQGLNTTTAMLMPDCLLPSWNDYAETVQTLADLAESRPHCPGCCAANDANQSKAALVTAQLGATTATDHLAPL